jgi:DNA polymerase, archaea type
VIGSQPNQPKGFLSSVLKPLLELRMEIKGLKKTHSGYSGLDKVLKRMLVTCFGYAGYRNAKFGSIEVHERITSTSRGILLLVKKMAGKMDLEVFHGISGLPVGSGVEERRSSRQPWRRQ